MTLSIDYTPPPTGEKFMQSDAKMRVLMGPVGCLPAESEFLTPQGWVRMDEWEPGVHVGVWDQPTGRVRFEAAEYVRLPAEGGFLRFDSGSLVMDLSPEHRVAYYDYNGGFKVQVASQVARKPSNRLIPTTFTLEREDAPLSDHEVRMRVMFAADGSIPAAGRRVAVCVRKARKVRRLKELLVGVPHKHTVYDRGVEEHVFRFEWPYGTAGKSLDFVWGLSTRQLRVVLDEMDHWDGLYAHEEKRFHTTCLESAEAMQFAAHACGLRANIGVEDYPQDAWNRLYRVYIRRDGSPKNVARVRGDHTRISEVPSVDGWKYCFVTSTGFFVVRHRGTVFITGNSGKSVTCSFEIIRRAALQASDPNTGKRRSRCAVVRETARQLQDTTIKTFLDWFPPGVCGRYMRTTKTYFFEVGDIECEIMFRALDDADDVANLNSLELTFAWFNECRDIHPEIVDAMSKRIGRFPSAKDGGPTWFGMWGDTNPPTMDTWWYYQLEHLDPKDGVSPNNNGWDVFKQPSGRSVYAENIENLPEGYYDTQGRSEEYIRVFIDGEYGLSSNGQPVYKYFRPDYHMASQTLRPILNGVRPLIVGVDLGLTPAAVIGQQDPRGRALILDELVSFDMGIQRFVRTMLKPLLYERFSGAPVLIVVDPSGVQRAQTDERSAVDIIKAEGLKVIPAKTNRISARINAVDDYLMRQVDGDPAFLVDPRCTRLKAAMMGGYRFDKNGGIDKNKHSHCFVAGTPVETPTGPVPIEQIAVGDMVLTPFGPQPVTATMSRETDMFTVVRFADGAAITCTPDHPFYTERGIVLAEDLQYTDVLLSLGDNTLEPKKVSASYKSRAEPAGATEKSYHTPAHTAEHHLSAFVEQTSADIAALHVRQQRGLPAELTTKCGNALYAQVTSELIATRQIKPAPRIVSVSTSQQSPQRVYDLTVAQVHSFYACNMWVSNCAEALQYLCLHIASVGDGHYMTQRREIKAVASAGWT